MSRKFTSNEQQDPVRSTSWQHDSAPNPEIEPDLHAALANFRDSVHAWSDASFSRTHAAIEFTPRRFVGRTASAWALSLVLAAGFATAGLQQHREHEQAKLAAARQAQQRQLEADQHAQESEDLLARVDSDISREVPAAMEPLAQLMAEEETR